MPLFDTGYQGKHSAQPNRTRSRKMQPKTETPLECFHPERRNNYGNRNSIEEVPHRQRHLIQKLEDASPQFVLFNRS